MSNTTILVYSTKLLLIVYCFGMCNAFQNECPTTLGRSNDFRNENKYTGRINIETGRHLKKMEGINDVGIDNNWVKTLRENRVVNEVGPRFTKNRLSDRVDIHRDTVYDSRFNSRTTNDRGNNRVVRMDDRGTRSLDRFDVNRNINNRDRRTNEIQERRFQVFEKHDRTISRVRRDNERGIVESDERDNRAVRGRDNREREVRSERRDLQRTEDREIRNSLRDARRVLKSERRDTENRRDSRRFRDPESKTRRVLERSDQRDSRRSNDRDVRTQRVLQRSERRTTENRLDERRDSERSDDRDVRAQLSERRTTENRLNERRDSQISDDRDVRLRLSERRTTENRLDERRDSQRSDDRDVRTRRVLQPSERRNNENRFDERRDTRKSEDREVRTRNSVRNDLRLNDYQRRFTREVNSSEQRDARDVRRVTQRSIGPRLVREDGNRNDNNLNRNDVKSSIRLNREIRSSFDQMTPILISKADSNDLVVYGVAAIQALLLGVLVMQSFQEKLRQGEKLNMLNFFSFSPPQKLKAE